MIENHGFYAQDSCRVRRWGKRSAIEFRWLVDIEFPVRGRGAA
jgi:hypothetical protein